MKKLFALLILFVGAGAAYLAYTDGFFSEMLAKPDIDAAVFRDTNEKCIEVEFGDEEAVLNAQAEIMVRIPDYTALYLEACQTDDPDRFLLEALESGDYTVQEHWVTADVTVTENGETVVHSEEAVQALLEQEMSKAVQALMEVGTP